MQYHVEIEPDTIAKWGKIPAYRDALASTLGPAGLAMMQSEADTHMPAFLAGAERLCRNFIEQTRGAA